MSRTPESEEFDTAEEDDLDEHDQKRQRTKWEPRETADLVDGCYVHGVGAWKKILNDPKYQFHNRTPVDLKDRFRTIHPQEYKRLYPDAQRVHAPRNPLETPPPPFDRIKRKQRRPFTKEEDDQLWLGVKKHGVAWSKISKDSEFGLLHRRSTDLRDRYRNAFPNEYEALGYSTRPAKKKKFSGNLPHTSSPEPDDITRISSDIYPDPALEAVVHGGADEDEQNTFWEEPSTSTSQRHRQEAGYETSVPISRHAETHINPLVATPVFMESKFSKFPFGQRSPSSGKAPMLINTAHLVVTPKVNKIVGARIKAGQAQYKVSYQKLWTAGDELPPGSEPRVTEFFNVLSNSVSPLRALRTV